MNTEANMPIVLTHVGIFVTDIKKMENFYTQFLGLVVTDRGFANDREYVWLSHSCDEHHQIVLASGRPADVPFNVVNQVSFRVANLAVLRRLYSNLSSQPVKNIAPVTHGNAVSVYFQDPEGNKLEIYVTTPWHVSQPVRIPIDLNLAERDIWDAVKNAIKDLPGFAPKEQWQKEVSQRLASNKASSPLWSAL
jgi:catechol 2,3-dioxygenase